MILNPKNLRIPGTVKRFLYHPSLYRQGEDKNIFLFSSRRGGSTLLAQLISYQQGIRYVDQPFDLFQSHTKAGKTKLHYLPAVPNSQFIALSSEEESLVKEYVSLLLKGKLKYLGGLERFKFPFLANRTLLKICNASPLIDWFNANFNILTCYLVRHPIPQSLSVMKNQWGITAEAYLNNEKFIDSFLNHEQVNQAHKILREGTYFQKAILNWCLENLVPLKYCSSNVLKITYEELVLNPANLIPLISTKLNIEDGKEIMRRVEKPSRSSKLSEQKARKAILEGDKEKIVSRWMKQVSAEQLNEAKVILELFEIIAYKTDDYLPVSTLLLC
ncbi:MAG: hypothetical protein F6K41_07310 [Symploca sp. SIO3E6]|nr:hypothetical protein [Caldora sp. SIO3E6]